MLVPWGMSFAEKRSESLEVSLGYARCGQQFLGFSNIAVVLPFIWHTCSKSTTPVEESST